MHASLIVALLLAGQLLTGWSSAYAPSVMEGVVPRQQAYGRLSFHAPYHEGYAATSSCALMGQRLYARPQSSSAWTLLWVTDCAGDSTTVAWMENRGGDPILIEVDAVTATLWNMQPRRGLRIEVRLFTPSARTLYTAC